MLPQSGSDEIRLDLIRIELIKLTYCMKNVIMFTLMGHTYTYCKACEAIHREYYALSLNIYYTTSHAYFHVEDPIENVFAGHVQVFKMLH